MDERVDVIDQSGRTLYSVSKSKAHHHGLLHKTVIAEIRRSNGDWVLVRQAADKQDSGQFVSPVGGHVGAGETDIDALQREALEEAGIVVTQARLIGRIIHERTVIGRHENHMFVVYEIESDQDIVLNEESVEYRQFSNVALKEALHKKPDDFGDAFHFLIAALYPDLKSTETLL